MDLRVMVRAATTISSKQLLAVSPVVWGHVAGSRSSWSLAASRPLVYLQEHQLRLSPLQGADLPVVYVAILGALCVLTRPQDDSAPTKFLETSQVDCEL
jgi:hypothetical protein